MTAPKRAHMARSQVDEAHVRAIVVQLLLALIWQPAPLPRRLSSLRRDGRRTRRRCSPRSRAPTWCRRARASAERSLELTVKEGDQVERGAGVATVGDEKIALQMKSLDAQIAGLDAQLAQAQTDLTRAEEPVRARHDSADPARRGAHRNQCRDQRASRPHRRARGDRAATRRRRRAGPGRRPRAEGAGHHRHRRSPGRAGRDDGRAELRAAPARAGAPCALPEGGRSRAHRR